MCVHKESLKHSKATACILLHNVARMGGCTAKRGARGQAPPPPSPLASYPQRWVLLSAPGGMPPATGGVEPTEDNTGYRQAISVPDRPLRVGIAVPGECARAMAAAGGRSAATMPPKTDKERPRVTPFAPDTQCTFKRQPVRAGLASGIPAPDVPRGTGAPHVQAMYRTVGLWCETKERYPDGVAGRRWGCSRH